MKTPLVPVVALEEIEEVPLLSEGEQAEQFINLTEREQRLGEVAQVLDTGVRLVIGLENFADYLLDSMIDGEAQTWNATEQRMVDLHLDSLYNGASMERPFELSMESIGRSRQDVVADIKAHALKILKAVIVAFKKVFEYIKDFLHAATAYAARLAMQARRMEVDCRELKDVRTAETYEDKYLARQLYTPTGELLQTYQLVMELVYGAVHVANGPLAGELEHLLRELKKADDTKVLPDLAKVVEQNYHPAFNYTAEPLPYPASHLDVPQDCAVYETPIMFNGAIGVGFIPQSNAALHRFEFRIIETGLYDKQTEGVSEVEVSSLDEIRALLRLVNGVASGIHIFEREERKLDSFRRDLDSLQSSIAGLHGDMGAVDKDILKALGQIAPKLMMGMHRASFAYALNVSRQVLNHCRKSMAKYEPKN